MNTHTHELGLWLWLHGRPIGETAKAWAEIFAYASAAGYFLYRLSRGYFFPNLSVRVCCDRKPSRKDGYDYLSIDVCIEKGDHGALNLHDVQYRIDGGKPSSLEGLERLTSKSTNTTRKLVQWRTSISSPRLNFSPGERAHFSTWCEVTRPDPHLIEVVVLGFQHFATRSSEWRSSAVSLPEAPQPTHHPGEGRPNAEVT
jgi:hypothetical protein